MSIWSDLIKAIQLKARYLFGMWLAGILILFAPDGLAKILKIDKLRDDYGAWIGLATLAGFSFWLVQIYPTIKDWKYERGKRADLLDSIFYLPLEQRAVLAIALYRDNPIISKPISDSLIEPLWNRGMIDAMGELDECYNNGPCKIEGFVWRYIKKNRDKVLTEEIKGTLQRSG